MTVKEFDDFLKEQGLTKSQIQDLDYQISRHITYNEAEAYPGTLHEKAAAFYEHYRKIVAETDREHYLDNAKKMFDRYIGTQNKNKGTVAAKLIKQMGEFRYDFSFMDEVAAAEYLVMIYNRSENNEMSGKFAKYYDSMIEQLWKHNEIILFKYIFMQEIHDAEDMVAVYHYNSNRPNGQGEFILQCEVNEFFPHDLSQAANIIFELGAKEGGKPIDREVGLQMLSGGTNIDALLKSLKD